ncbi:mitochondrial 37S ribosomal protein mS38 [Aspergillus homomorphus CBS 101889]|uniref:Small ribosomal subunit protein mS38 n=1 Tax=Aspergillus homomorphus (strain CBS 101889) TaxID=1450537 RepID=A0A395I698_ASPHC|nr:hypothetical protein BO97DRAFT_468274 [Aspergillus homomorphus CBS 101889]RAL15325.1 hypothetical protein BO97DRAFT_468274 [Aspergillus homomorphus CBS 101889]
MLSSSLRRAVWAPIVPISGITRASSQTLTTSSNNLTGSAQPVRQRRYSSSSSSKPSDGSRKLDASSQTPAKEVNSGKSTRRRGKDSNGRAGSKQQQQQQTAFSRLPSVPSTQHLLPHDVQVASFFSIHRPISVSTSVPPTSTSEAFDSIFTARKPGVDDVISTLSSAVQTLEGGDQDPNHYHNVLQEMTNRHYQSVMQQQQHGQPIMDMSLSIEELTKRLRPFHPPPPPVPMDEVSAAATAAAEQQTDAGMTESYSTVLTIHESTLPDGSKTYQAHTGPFMPTQDMGVPGAADAVEAYIDVDPSGNAGLSYIEQNTNGPMHALSTKRRRRLKMKKHKFKKLLRKTRTLRRKLEKS